MKNWNTGIVMSAALVMALPAFASPKKAAVEKETKIAFSPAASVVGWEAKKVTGKHNGKIALKKGEIVMKGKELVGGNFEIDMETIAIEDLKDAAMNTKLLKHLKSDDFFSVEKFKTANLKITSAKAVEGIAGPTYEVTGDLTIKGKTLPITFPVVVETKDGKTTAKANLTIDRTNYDIKYGSGKFFQNLGDKMIEDKFALDVLLASKK